jgi:hypothetical protein
MLAKLVNAKWPFLKENKVTLSNFLKTFRRTKGHLARNSKKQFFRGTVKMVWK